MVCFFGLSHSIGCWLAPICAGPMWNSLGPSLLALRGTPTPSPCLALPTIARVICVRRWSAQAWCSKHSPRAHKRAHVHANALPGGSACFHHDDLQASRATSSRAGGCSAWCAWRSWWRTRRPNLATAPTCAACAPPVRPATARLPPAWPDASQFHGAARACLSGWSVGSQLSSNRALSCKTCTWCDLLTPRLVPSLCFSHLRCGDGRAAATHARRSSHEVVARRSVHSPAPPI